MPTGVSSLVTEADLLLLDWLKNGVQVVDERTGIKQYEQDGSGKVKRRPVGVSEMKIIMERVTELEQRFPEIDEGNDLVREASMRIGQGRIAKTA